MTDETQSPIGFEEAARRLDHALSRLEVRVNALVSEAQAANGGLFDEDRAQLAAELDASRARERELEAAGKAASQALHEAIVGVRAALGD
jgi:hypothetical protein